MDAQLSGAGWRVVALPRTELDITNEGDVRNAVELFRRRRVDQLRGNRRRRSLRDRPRLGFCHQREGPAVFSRARAANSARTSFT